MSLWRLLIRRPSPGQEIAIWALGALAITGVIALIGLKALFLAWLVWLVALFAISRAANNAADDEERARPLHEPRRLQGGDGDASASLWRELIRRPSPRQEAALWAVGSVMITAILALIDLNAIMLAVPLWLVAWTGIAFATGRASGREEMQRLHA